MGVASKMGGASRRVWPAAAQNAILNNGRLVAMIELTLTTVIIIIIIIMVLIQAAQGSLAHKT
jgi:hypothetical protein